MAALKRVRSSAFLIAGSLASCADNFTMTYEARFANHRRGTKDASVVKRYGIRLLPELYAHLNPMPYAAALQMEMDLAEDLRRAGYTVTGGH